MDSEAKSCTFRWEIQNVSQCWWLRKGEGIYSPAFIADGLGCTKWSLCFIPMGEEDCISFALKRQKDCGAPYAGFEIDFRLVCLNRMGLIIKSEDRRLKFMKNMSILIAFLRRDKVFLTERELYLPEDTLTVQCTMWAEENEPVKTNYISSTTIIKVKRRYCMWKVGKPNTPESGIKNKYNDNLIDFDLLFGMGFNRLEMKIASVHDNVKFISCKTSVLNSEGKKIYCGFEKYPCIGSKKAKTSSELHFDAKLLENKRLYFPNDFLSLYIEFVISTIEQFGSTTNFVEMEYHQKDDAVDEDDEKIDGMETAAVVEYAMT